MTKQKNKYQLGANWGKWTLLKKLGEGGDGEVWEALSDNTICAIKILKTNDAEQILRFKQEINLLKDCKNIKGIVKIIDCDSSKYPKWFTMPIAENSFEFVKEKNLAEKIRLVSNLASSLTELHQQNITHRDIKPSNILLFNNNLILNDFGFGHHPYRDIEISILSKRRGIGAIATSAPEMRRYYKDYKVNDFKPADVYSLAKTLWIYLTGNKLGFDGEYGPNSIFSLKNYLNKEFHGLLPSIENLLIKSTKEDPLQRPNIQSFRNELIDIWKNIDNFERNNQIHWLAIIKQIFPTSIPKYAKWDNIDDILKIFSYVIKVEHYAFYPNHEGNTFTEIKSKNGKIEFFTKMKSSLLIKTPILTFNSFEKDPTLNYFRLECQYKQNQKFKNGIFVFFCKSSSYNKSQHEDGKHNEVSEHEFRKIIEKTVNYF